MREISSPILQVATANPGWGYTRIQGALKNLGHGVARSTVAKVLQANGISPAHAHNALLILRIRGVRFVASAMSSDRP